MEFINGGREGGGPYLFFLEIIFTKIAFKFGV